MQKLNTFLLPLVKRIGGSKKYNEQALKYYWDKIIGPELAEKCLPIKVENGILFLCSQSSILNNQLLIMKSSIIEQINTFLKVNFVKDIFFSHGNLNEYMYHTDKKSDEEIEFNERSITLSDEQKHEIDNLTKDIADKQFKKQITAILIKDKKYKIFLINKGYKPCKGCTSLVNSQDGLCVACKIDKKQEHKTQIATILKEVPWITHEECQKYLKCDKIIFDNVKKNLAEKIKGKLQSNYYSRQDLLTYVMLVKECSINSLNDEIIDSVLQTIQKQ